VSVMLTHLPVSYCWRLVNSDVIGV